VKDALLAVDRRERCIGSDGEVRDLLVFRIVFDAGTRTLIVGAENKTYPVIFRYLSFLEKLFHSEE
jgi:hypothetical protein